MSKSIPIPKSPQSQTHSVLKSATYCYIKADEDHHDLEDLFSGKYLKSQEIWRFPKNLEQQVYNFLDCSSSESEECESDEEILNSNDSIMDRSTDNELIKGRSKSKHVRRDRLHRANSFNASDESNDGCDSLDENFRRRRQPIEKLSLEKNKLKKEAEKY